MLHPMLLYLILGIGTGGGPEVVLVGVKAAGRSHRAAPVRALGCGSNSGPTAVRAR